MRHTEDYFPTHDGLRLFWQRWQPDDPTKAVLIIVHGVAEHSGRYGNLVEGLLPKLNPSHLSCDSRVVQTYVDDPLVFKTMTARWGTEFLDTQSRVVARAGEIDIPILLVHGEADQICLVDGVRRFFADIASPDKDLIIYPGGYHETHNEPGHIREIEDIASWIEAHLPGN